MSITFEGTSLTAGVFVVSGALGAATKATVAGSSADMNDPTCVGAAFNHFSVEIDCDCEPQKGDWIRISSTTIGIFHITTYSWFLCGGACSGEKTRPGLALGLEIKFAKWIVN